MNHKTSLASAILLSSFLAACGGGSDSDNPTNNNGGGSAGEPGSSTGGTTNEAPLKITSANAKNVASFATSFLDFGISSSGQASQATSRSNSNASRQTRAAASFPCEVSGTFSVDVGDGDENIEVGDFFQINMNSCATREVDEKTGQNYIETENGTLRFEISEVISENNLTNVFSMDLISTTDHGHSGSTKGGGTMGFKLEGANSYQTTGSFQFTSIFDGESIRFNPMTSSFTQTGSQYSYDFNTTVSGSAINGSISVATGPALTGTSDDEGENNYPTGGQLTITGTDSSIVLDAGTGNPNTVLMTINENGTVTSETINWSELDDPQPLS